MILPDPVSRIRVELTIFIKESFKSLTFSRSTSKGILHRMNSISQIENEYYKFQTYFLRFLNSLPSLDPLNRISCRLLSATNKSKLVHSFLLASNGLNSKLSCLSGMIYNCYWTWLKLRRQDRMNATCLTRGSRPFFSTMALYLRIVLSKSLSFLSRSLTMRQISGRLSFLCRLCGNLLQPNKKREERLE